MMISTGTTPNYFWSGNYINLPVLFGMLMIACCLHTRPSFDNVCFSMLFHSVQVIPPCSMEIRTARNFLMLENLDYLPVYVYYVYYMSIYTYVRVTCMWIIYIYTQYSIYIYTICTWMDMYIVHVHTCLCIYLCMHVLLITINAFRIIRAVARSHPLSSTPSFCCRWRPSQGDQLIDSTNKNEGINPTLVRLVTTGSEIDAKFLLLLSVVVGSKNQYMAR